MAYLAGLYSEKAANQGSLKEGDGVKPRFTQGGGYYRVPSTPNDLRFYVCFDIPVVKEQKKKGEAHFFYF